MKAVLRALWLISGILLVVFGIYALFHPAQTLLSMTMFLGIATVLSGVFSIAAYIWQRGELFGGGWILLDGILDTLLGIFLLVYPTSAIVASVLLTLLSLWIAFKGITMIFHSIQIKSFDSHWGTPLGIGILLLLFGLLSLFQPIVAATTISVILGTLLISGGIEVIVHWWMMHKFRKSLGL